MKRNRILLPTFMAAAIIAGPADQACIAQESQYKDRFLSTGVMQATGTRVPERFGRLVERHVNSMYREDYFYELCLEDLDHGHALIHGNETVYRSMEDFLSKTGIVLYHTDEFGKRWKAFNLSPELKPQRSVVGHMDGRISPAKNMIRKQKLSSLKHYSTRGTIQFWELGREDPRYKEDVNNHFIMITGSKPCRTVTQFDIIPEEAGRFEFPKGRFDVYMVCY